MICVYGHKKYWKFFAAFSLFTIGSLAWPQEGTPNVVIQWNNAALQGVRDSKLGPPMVSRALAIVHTCIYDAWAAYDGRALGTQLGGSLRQPLSERNLTNKNKAISFAAYRAAVDLFPGDDATVFRPLMEQLGHDPEDRSTDTSIPSGVGNVACDAVLQFRHHDGSNQLGDLSGNGVPYADYTGYQPVNSPSPVPSDPATVVDVNRWQPLQYFDASHTFVTQSFVGAHWFKVLPFALRSGDELRSELAGLGPPMYGSSAFLEEAEELVSMSAQLTDEQKMIAEYFADGPHSELPPGHWDLFAQFVSARDHHGVDEDAKMFFALTNAIFDAGIVAWDAKRAFDSVRPATSIPYLFQGQQIRAWGGPGKSTITMDGRFWIPYQVSTFPTPAFPEYISGHSTFSAAGAQVLLLFTGSDQFGDSVTLPAGSSNIEPGITPANPVTLYWNTFTDAANQAGISRRYGGIHFKAGDYAGRAVGRIVGYQAWIKAWCLWKGSVLP
ncbi:MAG: phosphatase PAP2 family protein [Acidobacteriaceae bacterium]|nr:phosphatase PAP2 family protein [Acidobacteriaceae bacterium]